MTRSRSLCSTSSRRLFTVIALASALAAAALTGCVAPSGGTGVIAVSDVGGVQPGADVSDAGTATDTSGATDTGANADAGKFDSKTVDAGTLDAGASTDTGSSDTGGGKDAGCPSCCKSNAACDDGDSCTADTCDLANGTCKNTAIPGCGALYAPCSAKAPCKTGVCDPTTNACVPCLQAKDCGANKACRDRVCVAATSCKSDVQCKATNQVCNVQEGVCVDCNVKADCPAGSTCSLGMCKPAPACKSSKDCPQVCDTSAGVCVQCLQSADCPQGTYCGAGNTCRPAVCKTDACAGAALFLCKADGSGYKPQADCDDGQVCTDDGCDNAKGCVTTPNAASCNDGDPCTSNDACKNGGCTGPQTACDDKNPCTSDTCQKGSGCVYTVNSAACDDGSVCTQKDTCKSGACAGGSPLSCDDKNACTTDSCDAKKGCVFTFNTKPCDDGDKCTDKDNCQGGKCVGNSTKCSDGNPCTDDGCSKTGGCTYTNNSASCDDGNSCTEKDTCKGGSCSAGVSKNCSDGNPCTSDSCDKSKGCVHSNNTTYCNDGDACTSNDRCKYGKCVGYTKSCNDGNSCTTDSCDKSKGCVYAANTASCSDGDLCTQGDTCANKACKSGTQTKVCNDSDACTADTCDPKKGCVYVGGAGKCNDFNACTLDACDKATGSCKHSAVAGCCTKDSQCDDKDATTQDYCSGATCTFVKPVKTACKTFHDCNDGDGCTVDKCDTTAGTCSHTKDAKCPFYLPKWDFEDGKLDGWQITPSTSASLTFRVMDQTGKSGGKKSLRGGHKTLKTFYQLKGANYFYAVTPAFTLTWDRRYKVETVYKWLLTSGYYNYNKLRIDVLYKGKSFYVTQYSGSSSSSYKSWKTGSAFIDAWAGKKIQLKITGRIGNYSSTSGSYRASGEGVFIDELRVVDAGPAEKCTADSQCYASGACLTGYCGGGGFCKYLYLCCTKNAECGDGNACTTDYCSGGKCKFSKKASCCTSDATCDDGKPCTKDVCTSAGTCTHIQTPGCCSSTSDCTEAKDSCSAASCTIAAGASSGTCSYQKLCCATDKDCDDGDNTCTTDKCVNAKCSYTPTGAAGCCTPELFSATFDDGAAKGITFSNSAGTTRGWQVWKDAVLYKSKAGALYYGEIKYKNYKFSGTNSGYARLPEVALPSDKAAKLDFWVYADVESSKTYDMLYVYASVAGGSKATLWKKNKTKAWEHVQVDLSAYKGKKVKLEFYFKTGDSTSNATKGIFIDDLKIVRPCP